MANGIGTAEWRSVRSRTYTSCCLSIDLGTGQFRPAAAVSLLPGDYCCQDWNGRLVGKRLAQIVAMRRFASTTRVKRRHISPSVSANFRARRVAWQILNYGKVSSPGSTGQAQCLDFPGDPPAGVGASAGGVATLRSFFSNVPRDSGLAFVVVMHLAPEHRSYLPQLLQSHASVPVKEVTATMQLAPDHRLHHSTRLCLTAVDTHLRLSSLDEKRYARGPDRPLLPHAGGNA